LTSLAFAHNRAEGLADKGRVWRRGPGRLRGDTGGTVSVEYTVLLVLVAIGVSAAIVAIGMPLVSRYQFMKLLIGLPLP
jgi:Flp pilus assembly pilin Flp